MHGCVTGGVRILFGLVFGMKLLFNKICLLQNYIIFCAQA